MRAIWLLCVLYGYCVCCMVIVRAIWLLQFCMVFINNLDIDACVSMLLPSSSYFFLIKLFVTYTAIHSMLYHFVPFVAVVLAVSLLLFHFFPLVVLIITVSLLCSVLSYPVRVACMTQ